MHRFPSPFHALPAACAAAALVLLASVASAQDTTVTSTAIRPGAFVRVRLLDRRTTPVRGTVVALDSARYVLRRAASLAREPRVIPRDSIRSIDLRVLPGGRTRGAIAGASFVLLMISIGALAGGEDAVAMVTYRGPQLVPALVGGTLVGMSLAPSGQWAQVVDAPPSSRP